MTTRAQFNRRAEIIIQRIMDLILGGEKDSSIIVKRRIDSRIHTDRVRGNRTNSRAEPWMASGMRRTCKQSWPGVLAGFAQWM